MACKGCGGGGSAKKTYTGPARVSNVSGVPFRRKRRGTAKRTLASRKIGRGGQG